MKQTMVCPKCRTKLPGNPPNCPGCGTLIRYPPGPKAKAAGKVFLGLTIGSVVIVGGIFLVVVLLIIFMLMANI